jgi:hypothetical protein
MSEQDLTEFLRRWPHETGRINARKITGEDGQEKIQVRIDLGVLQMEVDGRPDGLVQEGFPSQLEYQLNRLERYTDQSGGEAGFALSADECRALREEAVQYYHRYVALFALGDYPRVVRDAERNLRVIDLCRDHAAEETDRHVLEQFRPHLITMRTRGEAELALSQEQPKQALAAIDRGLEELKVFFRDAAQPEQFEQSNDAQLLMGMREALVPKLPASQRVELEERLRAAIDAENYELAAILRDEIKMLEE